MTVNKKEAENDGNCCDAGVQLVVTVVPGYWDWEECRAGWSVWGIATITCICIASILYIATCLSCGRKHIACIKCITNCFWVLVRVCCRLVPLHYPVCAARDVPPEMKPTYQLNTLVMDLKGFLSFL